MASVAEIQELYRYNRWATGQILSCAEKLTSEQFTAEDDTPFGSIRNELVHIMDAQNGWVDIWQADLSGIERNPVDFDPGDYPDVESLYSLWEEVELRTDAFLESLEEAALSRNVRAEFAWGDLSSPLWVMLVHIVTHGIQHRSEVAMKLTNFGHSPGMLDLIFYWVENNTTDQPDAGFDQSVLFGS